MGASLQLETLLPSPGRESGPGEAGRKFGFPQRALSTCFLTAGRQASALSRFTRGRKGRVVFFLPFAFAACPSASAGLVSGLPAPSLLPHTVCLPACPVLSMPPALPLTHLASILPPWNRTAHPWARDFCQPLGPAGQTHLPACARPARAQWLNLQPVFLSYSTDVAQALG